MKYKIGTTFKTRGKSPRLCTVIDILKTYNSEGELVQTRYIATHEFSGQTVTERDVVATTIAMGLVSEPPAPVKGCCQGHTNCDDCTTDCVPF